MIDLRALLLEHYPLACKIAAQYPRARWASPRDVAHEAILRALRYGKHYDGRRFDRWLWAVVRHAAASTFARTDEPLSNDAPLEWTDEDRYRREETEAMRAAVCRLKPHEVVALERWYRVRPSISRPDYKAACQKAVRVRQHAIRLLEDR